VIPCNGVYSLSHRCAIVPANRFALSWTRTAEGEAVRLPRSIEFKSTKRYNNKSVGMISLHNRLSMQNLAVESEAASGAVERRSVETGTSQWFPMNVYSMSPCSLGIL
jgi:hypothetical protein